MEKLHLAADERTILGKKVKKLRKEGKVPANIFAKDFKSISIQVDEKEFRRIFKSAGETGIIEIKVGGQVYPCLVNNMHRDPITNSPQHVDFHKVNLKEKITANVPLKVVGESVAEKSGDGLVLQTLSELEVECLPSDIPHEIEVDIAKLTEVGQTIHVKDLKVDTSKVEVKNDPDEVVVSVQTAEMKEEPVEETVSPEDVEATAEKGEEAEGEDSQGSEEKTIEEPAEKPQE